MATESIKGNVIENVTASWSIDAQNAGLSPNAGLFAYKVRNILTVCGYILVNNDITINKPIASVSGVTLPAEQFVTSFSDSGNQLRLRLTRAGLIVIESNKPLLKNNWYSFSFVSFISN